MKKKIFIFFLFLIILYKIILKYVLKIKNQFKFSVKFLNLIFALKYKIILINLFMINLNENKLKLDVKLLKSSIKTMKI